jgi:hypothetical protein
MFTLDQMPAVLRQQGLSLLSYFTHYYIASQHRTSAGSEVFSYETSRQLHEFRQVIAQGSHAVAPMRVIAVSQPAMR